MTLPKAARMHGVGVFQRGMVMCCKYSQSLRTTVSAIPGQVAQFVNMLGGFFHALENHQQGDTTYLVPRYLYLDCVPSSSRCEQRSARAMALYNLIRANYRTLCLKVGETTGRHTTHGYESPISGELGCLDVDCSLYLTWREAILTNVGHVFPALASPRRA